MFNPAKAATEIKKEYIGYISTTFHFRNQNLQKKLVERRKRNGQRNEKPSDGRSERTDDHAGDGRTF